MADNAKLTFPGTDKVKIVHPSAVEHYESIGWEQADAPEPKKETPTTTDKPKGKSTKSKED